MKARTINASLANLPIIKRGNRFFLQKTFSARDGKKQRQIPLGTTNSKIAKSRCERFLQTVETDSYEKALEELTGKEVLKAGDSPTLPQISELYREYCKQNTQKERTIRTNLNRLKNVFEKGKFKTVGDIDESLIYDCWFPDTTPTESQKRTYYSAIRAAASVFSIQALKFYSKKNVVIENPFLGINLKNPGVQGYTPIPDKLRESIWDDCQTELHPNQAMVVLMALGIGMRRKEIEHALPSWFSKQADNVIVTIQETDSFIPKNGKMGQVPIPLNLYETLLELRGDSNDAFFVPHTNTTPKNRLYTPITEVCAWLRKKGLIDNKPLHCLRKELGSQVAKETSVLEASKILRQTYEVCAKYYAGISELSTVDMKASFTPDKTPEELLADKMGITVEQLTEKLSK